MPAKNLYRKDEEGIYAHIYNKGAEKRVIFNDGEDYAVFQGFLKDYLTAPQDPESTKKVFTVHGRTFRGTPHQPKNYFNKIELIAYSLMQDHFHLLLHQITKGSLESLIRSLCTRYSMYFNKKYQHTGALFEGPYKSVQIKDKTRLLHLTRYFHHAGGYCSYPEYLGTRVTSWVEPKGILSFLDKGTGEYKNFVEKYKFDQKEKELIEGIIFESGAAHLERREPASNVESSEEIQSDTNLKPLQRIPEVLTTTVAFLLLVGLGVRNIMVSTPKSPNPTPAPAVLSETAVKPKILTIKISDGATSVNIRQKPTTKSQKLGQAKDGDTFEFVSSDSGWYEVKLVTGSTGFTSETGFISATYIKTGGTSE